MEDFFATMDRDFDGRLSFEEFMGEESQIEKLFKNMDKNGDGLVTKQVTPTKIFADFLNSKLIHFSGVSDHLQEPDSRAGNMSPILSDISEKFQAIIHVYFYFQRLRLLSLSLTPVGMRS